MVEKLALPLLLSSLFIEVCDLSSLGKDSMLSDESFHAIHSCMIGSGFRFEDLPKSPMIGSFIHCCISLLSPRSSEGDISYDIVKGVDGRDMISMSAADVENIFDVDSKVASTIVLFISRQLTAHLPSRRPEQIDSRTEIELLVREAAHGPIDLTEVDFDDTEDHDVYYGSGCHGNFQAMVPKAGCLGGHLTGNTTLALIGDSKAAQWFPSLDMIARERGWRLLSFTKSGCPAISIPQDYPYSADRRYHECDEWMRLLPARLAEDRPDFAVLSFSHYYSHRARRSISGAEWREGLKAAAAQLRSVGVSPLLLLDTPHPEINIPTCLIHSAGDAHRCALLRPGALNALAREALAAAAGEIALPIIDPADWFCTHPAAPAAAAPVVASGVPVAESGRPSELDDEAAVLVPPGRAAESEAEFDVVAAAEAEGAAVGICPAVIGGVLVYLDGLHATTRYTRLLARSLGDGVDRALAAAGIVIN